MSEMHDDITARLSEYVDGELPERERLEIDAHLASCAACRTVHDDLRRIVAAAGTLGGSMPDRELWDGVALRLDAPAAGRVAAFTPDARRRFSFTLPQLAAAAVLLMLLSGGAVYLTRPAPVAPQVAETPDRGPLPEPAAMTVAFTDPGYENAVADLERTLAEGRSRLDPETVRVLELNLRAIDAAIEQCHAALLADPANSYLGNHLVSARQRKIALLRRATALTTGS